VGTGYPEIPTASAGFLFLKVPPDTAAEEERCVRTLLSLARPRFSEGSFNILSSYSAEQELTGRAASADVGRSNLACLGSSPRSRKEL
jgi:hypothetical protein